MLEFPKSERLCSKKTIELLFKEGKVEFLYPYRVVFSIKDQPDKIPPQVLFAVSRKNFKKAVHRNWIRRRMKEAYRLNKTQLADKDGNYRISSMGFMYIAKEKMPFQEIEKKILQIFKRFR